MKTVVVDQSMYGNTHLIADAIAGGLRDHAGTAVVSVGEADAALTGARTSASLSAVRRTRAA